MLIWPTFYEQLLHWKLAKLFIGTELVFDAVQGVIQIISDSFFGLI